MNKEEFVKLAVSSGYANKHAAEQYAEKTGREEFTDNDFIELYHTSMHWEGVNAGCQGTEQMERPRLVETVWKAIPEMERIGGRINCLHTHPYGQGYWRAYH